VGALPDVQACSRAQPCSSLGKASSSAMSVAIPEPRQALSQAWRCRTRARRSRSNFSPKRFAWRSPGFIGAIHLVRAQTHGHARSLHDRFVDRPELRDLIVVVHVCNHDKTPVRVPRLGRPMGYYVEERDDVIPAGADVV
jgi:hypothetical protein